MVKVLTKHSVLEFTISLSPHGMPWVIYRVHGPFRFETNYFSNGTELYVRVAAYSVAWRAGLSTVNFLRKYYIPKSPPAPLRYHCGGLRVACHEQLVIHLYCLVA